VEGGRDDLVVDPFARRAAARRRPTRARQAQDTTTTSVCCCTLVASEATTQRATPTARAFVAALVLVALATSPVVAHVAHIVRVDRPRALGDPSEPIYVCNRSLLL